MAAAFLVTAIRAEKIAVLAPEKTGISEAAAERLADAFDDELIEDSSQVDAAFRSIAVTDPFNLSIEAARRIGDVIGCDHFIFVKSETLRRASIDRPSYFEAYAAIFVVSTRTGRLVIWKLQSAEDSDSATAESALFKKLDTFARELASEIVASAHAEIARRR